MGVDPRDDATSVNPVAPDTDFLAGLDANALQGARLGVPTNFGFQGYSQRVDELFEDVLNVLESLGAEIVRGTDIPTADLLREKPGELERMLYDYKRDMNAYLAERGDPEFQSMSDIIAFNKTHADQELRYFPQNLLEMADATSDDDADSMRELSDRLYRLSREEGIDAVLREHQLDALIAPTKSPASMSDLANGEKYLGGASTLTAIAGYPIITVPAGRVLGLPVGVSFMGTAWSDAKLLSLAHAWEQATQMYRIPTFTETDIVLDPNIPVIEFPQVVAPSGD